MQFQSAWHKISTCEILDVQYALAQITEEKEFACDG